MEDVTTCGDENAGYEQLLYAYCEVIGVNQHILLHSADGVYNDRIHLWIIQVH